MNGYDIIGDIHGHDLILKSLLKKLGYVENRDGFYHPLKRKAIFVGDFINRGPNTPRVLKIIQNMHSNKQAFCILGNHEFGLLQKFVLNPSEINIKISPFIPWIKSLPLFLEFPNFRVVHAAWHFSSIEKLKKENTNDDNFIRSTMIPNSENKRAVRNILQGIKVNVPKEIIYRDRFGIKRQKARIRWWDKKKNLTGNDIFPASEELINIQFANNEILNCENYKITEKPLFFGHYCLPAKETKIIKNLICLDGCVSCDGQLWAYQYNNGEPIEIKNLIKT